MQEIYTEMPRHAVSGRASMPEDFSHDTAMGGLIRLLTELGESTLFRPNTTEI